VTSAGITRRDFRLTNRQVIRVDQDAIDASRIAVTGTPGRKTEGEQVFAKVDRRGDGIVGLFNTTTALHRSRCRRLPRRSACRPTRTVA